MISTEQAAFAAGIAHAASLAQIAALSLEIRDDAQHLRQRAAVEALRGLADGLQAQLGGLTGQANQEGGQATDAAS